MCPSPRILRWLAAGCAVFLLAGCGSTDGPGPDEPSSGGTGSTTPGESEGGELDVSAKEVRRSLASLDPCALLTSSSGNGIDAPSALTALTALTDLQGTTAGLDHCEAADQPVSARDSLDLTDTSWSFERLARPLGGATEKVSGHDVAVVDEGQNGCFVHTYLWQTQAAGRGELNAEATIFGSSCHRARTLAAAVISAADDEPMAGGDPAGVLVPAS